MTGGLGWAWIAAGIAGASVSSTVTASVAADPRVEHTAGLADKKSTAPAPPSTPLLATLVDTHGGACVALDADSPADARFDEMLADRVTGARIHIDPRLLELLRSLARAHPAARVELVSGYRSAKLNEMLRKKGHHVASHSQHSLGHAVDFRIVPAESRDPMDPLALEREIRAGGWEGGTGVYLSASDRFVHADVGPNRRWNGL